MISQLTFLFVLCFESASQAQHIVWDMACGLNHLAANNMKLTSVTISTVHYALVQSIQHSRQILTNHISKF